MAESTWLSTSMFYYLCRNVKIDEVRDFLPKMSLEEIDAREANRSTVLHAACYYGHAEIVKFLLERGASRSVEHKFNCLPYDEAENKEVKNDFFENQ